MLFVKIYVFGKAVFKERNESLERFEKEWEDVSFGY